MTELEYGINVANKFDLLFGDEDPSEVLSKAALADSKKKKGAGEKDAKTTAGNVLKEKTTRSTGKAPVSGEVEKTKEKERKIEGKAEPKGGKKEGEEWGVAKSASRTSGPDQTKTTNNRTAGGAQQPRTDRPPRSAPQGGKPEQGKENTSTAERRPQQPKPEGLQRSPAAAGGAQQAGQQPQPQQQGGPRGPRFGGPRPEGSAPPRRSAPMEQDFGATTGPMTGEQEMPPEQRSGFGGRGSYRGGPSFRGGRASPRHPYTGPREPGQEGAAPPHARGREFERHSGSNKTGVKPMAKRDGAGPYNWGSSRDEAEIGIEAVAAPEGAVVPPAGEEGAPAEGAAPVVEGQEAQTGGEAAPATEEAKEPQVHEKTLKEWLEEEERNRVRPKFTTRAANEGEPEQKVFQKMRRVQREKAGADGMVEVVEYVEVDVDEDSHAAQGGNGKGGQGGPFQLVFAPASRPPRGTGEGGPRGRGGRGGPPRGGGFGGRGGGPRGGQGGKQAAPPAQDELNFPPLG